VSVDNYGLTLIDLQNVVHKDDPWVLAYRVAQVFYVLDTETGKQVVENVEDNEEDINQFKEMPLFTNPMNIKHIEKDFDKNLMPNIRKGGNGKFV
jgi:hypothetical protein